VRTHAASAKRKHPSGQTAGSVEFARIPLAWIKAFVEEIVERFNPEKIILFGSYAYGRPTADSDVDLMVIMPYRGSAPRQAAKISTAVRAPFALDLMVRSPQEIRRRMAMNDYFIHDVIEKGRVLHES